MDENLDLLVDGIVAEKGRTLVGEIFFDIVVVETFEFEWPYHSCTNGLASVPYDLSLLASSSIDDVRNQNYEFIQVEMLILYCSI